VFYLHFVAFRGEPPREGASAAGAQTLWEPGNIAFGVPDLGFTVCLCTFGTSACVEAQG